ncbi:MAG: hypothetical protein KAS18_04325 [Calditrichia bacterium]|nr:hypothetical protein [Calditrichia bacterium]
MKNNYSEDIQRQKEELILLRIKNNYYHKDEVLEKVVEEILDKSVKKDTSS